MSRILVTGGCGFIGCNLVKKLVSLGHDVTSYDNYISGRESNQIPGARYIKADTRDIEKVLSRDPSYDVCFHLAEYSRVATSFEDIERVWESNSTGTFRVLQYCRKNSTKVVYGGSSTRFAPEGISHSPYAFTKTKSCELLHNFSEWYGMSYAICYFYCVFGKGCDTTPVPGYQSVIDIFEKQYRAGTPLTVTGDGTHKRAFTYIDDVVDGLISAWRYDGNESFQLNADKEHSILEVAKMFTDNIVFIPQRPGDRSTSLGSINNKSRDLLGWTPTLGVEEWISRIVEEIDSKRHRGNGE